MNNETCERKELLKFPPLALVDDGTDGVRSMVPALWWEEHWYATRPSGHLCSRPRVPERLQGEVRENEVFKSSSDTQRAPVDQKSWLRVVSVYV